MTERINDAVGHVNSIQTLGTLDGPGVRFVVFMQGCNLRCSCCHNPETWRITSGGNMSEADRNEIKVFKADELASMAERYKSYFGRDGGVTLSGGEPLLQAEFCTQFFRQCHALGMNTCLDTSGSILNDNVRELLSHTDRILLDIKYHTDELYRKHVGCGIETPLRFLEEAARAGIPVTLRQVTVPTLNDNTESMEFLRALAKKHTCIDKIELLPFRNICQVKYDRMGMVFPFSDICPPSAEDMKRLYAELER